MSANSVRSNDESGHSSAVSIGSNSNLTQEISSSNTDNRYVRDVHRAGWLRYLPFNEKSNTSTDEHKFWVVFSIHNQNQPFLEFYQKQKVSQVWAHIGSAGGPVSTHSLMRCQHISPAIVVNEKCFNEFAITLDTHLIRLVAENQQSMNDWIKTIREKLRQLKIIEPKDNLYSKDPQLPQRRNSWRPLPPLPTFHSRTGSEPTTSAQSSIQTGSEPQDLYEAIFHTTDSIPRSLSSNIRPVRSSLEPLNSNVPLEEGPPPYETVSGNAIAPISLRESQVLRLRKEITHPSGVRLMVRRRDCHNSIALIDLSNNVWIAGWKQKEFPHLHNTFHIGDHLLSINGIPIANSSQAYDLMRDKTHLIEMIVKRVPNGRVFCIRRNTDGEDLGFIREKNTAEIKEVLTGGLADRTGLSSRCCSAEYECNWCLTEINNRSLNLFFKNNEIHDRLNSVGKEISILVQPFVFIKKLKKHLKLFKNFKDYIVQ